MARLTLSLRRASAEVAPASIAELGKTTSLMQKPRPVRMSSTLVLATITSGLLIRFGPLGLPRFVAKYGGSMLWALMIYWIVSALLPWWGVATVALLAGSVATTVEFLKLYHAPWLDSFRTTEPGVLLLGRFFSVWDILAYWLAITLGFVLDRYIRPKCYLALEPKARDQLL
jgi:hypothetical protein